MLASGCHDACIVLLKVVMVKDWSAFIGLQIFIF